MMQYFSILKTFKEVEKKYFPIVVAISFGLVIHLILLYICCVDFNCSTLSMYQTREDH